jgi:chloride channel protein, CIC family
MGEATLLGARWRKIIQPLQQSEAQRSLTLSLAIGALVGLVIVAFILLTGRMAARMYPAGGSGWRRILVPVAGSLGTGYLLWRFFPFARGSGIPQTKFALFINDGRILFRTVFGKFFCCSASLASGIALGREGPAVQIGAGLASVIARNAGLSKEQVKALVPVGCSAALAAAFNTPIAAVLFSLEEIMGDLHAPVLGAAVLREFCQGLLLRRPVLHMR